MDRAAELLERASHARRLAAMSYDKKFQEAAERYAIHCELLAVRSQKLDAEIAGQDAAF
jgi:hypothetical protein